MQETNLFNIYKFDSFGSEASKPEKITLVSDSNFISPDPKTATQPPINSLSYSHNSKSFIYFLNLLDQILCATVSTVN